MKVAIDPRIFDQLAALSAEEAIKELRALIVLADHGVVSAEIGTTARQQLAFLTPNDR